MESHRSFGARMTRAFGCSTSVGFRWERSYNVTVGGFRKFVLLSSVGRSFLLKYGNHRYFKHHHIVTISHGDSSHTTSSQAVFSHAAFSQTAFSHAAFSHAGSSHTISSYTTYTHAAFSHTKPSQALILRTPLTEKEETRRGKSRELS